MWLGEGELASAFLKQIKENVFRDGVCKNSKEMFTRPRKDEKLCCGSVLLPLDSWEQLSQSLALQQVIH